MHSSGGVENPEANGGCNSVQVQILMMSLCMQRLTHVRYVQKSRIPDDERREGHLTNEVTCAKVNSTRSNICINANGHNP